MNDNKKLDIDETFEKIGGFGPYQLLVFLIVGLTGAIPALIVHGYIFISGTPEFRCKIPGLLNDTFDIMDSNHESLINKYIPLKSRNPNTYETCIVYSYPNETDHSLNYTSLNASIEKCTSWVYSSLFYSRTIVTDWNLVCDNAIKKSTFSSLFFIGTYTVIFTGIIADKYGRRFCASILVTMIAFISVLLAILFNTNVSQSTKQIVYSILRFIYGSGSAIYGLGVVIAIEITAPRYRLIGSNCVYYFYIVGEYTAVLLAYFVRDYSALHIWTAAIICIIMLSFWFVPESPRWLLDREKNQEAYKILSRIAKWNKKSVPGSFDEFLLENSNCTTRATSSDKSEVKSEPVKLGFIQTLLLFCKSKRLLACTFSITLNWLSNNFVYYGITLGSGQLAGDPYLNVTLLATTELIAIACSQYMYQKYGRKVPYMVNMSASSVLLLVIYFIPKTMPMVITFIAYFGKFTGSFTFSGMYIITPELYPTSVRQTTLAICQVIGKFGAILSPYINLLGELYFQALPFLIYGSFAAISTILTFFFIPESKNHHLLNQDADIKV